MSKLVISFDSNDIGEFELDRERVTIGRLPDNDIVLSNDRAVSGHHAVIITIMADSFLEDMDSTNGTIVNGKTVGKHPLSDEDVIQIGRHNLRYEGKVTDYEDDFEKTMILKPSEIIAATAAGAKAPPPAAKPMLGRIEVTSGANSGKTLDLTKALTTLGKPGVQVAAITRRADGYYIVHVGPAGAEKRPQVNGAMISSQAQRLSDEDTIAIAGTQMKFSLVPQD